MKIGFIGLGNVGGKLAGSLLRNKFELIVQDLDQSLCKKFEEQGAKVVDTNKDLAIESDLIITCLPSPKVSSEVMEKKMEFLKAYQKRKFGLK